MEFYNVSALSGTPTANVANYKWQGSMIDSLFSYRKIVSALAGRSASDRHSMPHASIHPPNRGFTLIELIITITIAAILLGVALPAMQVFVENNRIKLTVGQLADSLNYARSEASKRRYPVSVCARTSDTSCAGGATWDGGWLVFTDDDGNGAIDGTNEVLRVVDSLPDHVTLGTSGFVTPSFVRYSSTGELNVSGRFKICNNRTGYENISRTIDVSAAGRANVDPNKYICSTL
jgi:type IV fimbrial biogenesis protein FimT